MPSCLVRTGDENSCRGLGTFSAPGYSLSMASTRKIFLINKRFQFRFAFYVCSWMIALSCAYPLVISNLFDYFFRYLTLDPLGPGLADLEKIRADVIWTLIGMEGFLVFLTFLICIFMSHRIAGPLYKLRNFFLDAKAGNTEQVLSFRKMDYFQELVPAYNEMMLGIRKKMEENTKGAELAILSIQKAIAVSNKEVQKELEIALESLREMEKK